MHADGETATRKQRAKERKTTCSSVVYKRLLRTDKLQKPLLLNLQGLINSEPQQSAISA